MKGAGIVFWKKENGKVYVLLAQRKKMSDEKKSGKKSRYRYYGEGYYSTFGGHREDIDYENGKLNFLNTAIRECAEETCAVDGKQRIHSKADLDKAKAFFLKSGFNLNPKPIRKINVPYYHFYTYECEVTETSKWFSESWEHEKGTMQWYPVDNLPKPMLFAAKVNVWQVKRR